MADIENLLFDMGNVLVRFEPTLFLDRLGVEGQDRTLLLREVFRSTDWVEMDRGTLDGTAAVTRMCARLPQRLHDAVEALVQRWDEPPLQIDGMEELVAELSEAGYDLYLLTNASARHHAYWNKYSVSRWFGNRIMCSADWKLLKPSQAFFEKALELFSLDRRTCLFIDDSPANVEAALQIGLDGLVFHGDADWLRRELVEKGVDLSQ